MMICVAEWPVIGRVYYAVDNTYSRPQAYWSTERRFAQPLDDHQGVRIGMKMKSQVTNIQYIQLDDPGQKRS